MFYICIDLKPHLIIIILLLILICLEVQGQVDDSLTINQRILSPKTPTIHDYQIHDRSPIYHGIPLHSMDPHYKINLNFIERDRLLRSLNSSIVLSLLNDIRNNPLGFRTCSPYEKELIKRD